MILQDTWIVGVQWDQELLEPITAKIEAWFGELPQLADIKVPRCLRANDLGQPARNILHVFSDTSQLTYGSAAYFESTYFFWAEIRSSCQ